MYVCLGNLGGLKIFTHQKIQNPKAKQNARVNGKPGKQRNLQMR